MIRKWGIENEQELKQCIDEVLTRLEEQGDARLGRLAAEELIDIVAAHVGPQAHNAAIEETKKLIQAKLADLEVDLDVLRSAS